MTNYKLIHCMPSLLGILVNDYLMKPKDCLLKHQQRVSVIYRVNTRSFPLSREMYI